MAIRTVTLDDLRERIARRISEYRVPREGQIGILSFRLDRAVTRTFKAHWTGFKLVFARDVLVVRTDLRDGRFWSEAYVSLTQPSWVLAFRSEPHPTRGSGGPRPDDKLALDHAVERAIQHRKNLITAGVIPPEELIRMEDFDDPLEAVDEFFNYTSFYVLKAVGASWDQIGYEPHETVAWTKEYEQIASLPMEAAIEEGLKKSDIIWLTPDTSPDGRPIPCWFVFKEGRLFVLSGERQQIIPDAHRVRQTKVVIRWKGRDARLAEFEAAVRPITANEPEEFEEVGQLLVAKRQGVVGTPEENLARWMREGVILELTPLV